LWGSAFVAIRVALRDYSPTQLSFFRLGAAAIVLSVVAPRFKVRRPARADLFQIFLVGLTGMALYQLLLNRGEVDVAAGTASLLVATGPVFSALLARLALKEYLNVIGWLGILVALGGSAVIAFEGGGLSLEPGALFVLGAAVVQAAFFVMQKPLLRRYTPFEITFYAMWLGTLLLAPFAIGLPHAISNATTSATSAVLWLAIGASAIGFVTWAYALQRIDVSIAVSTLYLAPVVAIVVGWSILGEVPTARALIGGAVALSGVALVTTRGKVRVLEPEPAGAT
jgi:drug/metabolite transporter (DMT)-like permease